MTKILKGAILWRNDWTPTFTGFSAAPTSVTSRYTIIGTTCFWQITGTAWASNTTAFTMTLPVVAANTFAQTIYCRVTDNNTVSAAMGRIATRVNSNIADCYPSLNATAWTGSNTKMVFASGQYEIG